MKLALLRGQGGAVSRESFWTTIVCYWIFCTFSGSWHFDYHVQKLRCLLHKSWKRSAAVIRADVGSWPAPALWESGSAPNRRQVGPPCPLVAGVSASVRGPEAAAGGSAAAPHGPAGRQPLSELRSAPPPSFRASSWYIGELRPRHFCGSVTFLIGDVGDTSFSLYAFCPLMFRSSGCRLSQQSQITPNPERWH